MCSVSFSICSMLRCIYPNLTYLFLVYLGQTVKNFKSIAHQIEWIYSVEFPGRPVPLVILSDGKPSYVINQWIYWLLEEGTPPATLELHISSLMQLYEFYFTVNRNRPITKEFAENFISDFLDVKRRGSQLMGWKPNPKKSTLQSYLYSLNRFDEWQSIFHGAHRMNPSEETFMSNYEIYRDFKRRHKHDPLIHMFPSQKHKKILHKHKVSIGHRRFTVGRQSIPKIFPIEKFVDFVERTPNPRDQMLWLLMGGGSLRKSEPLHLFYQDVLGVHDNGSTQIRLADPETGTITWEKNGRIFQGTRADYFDQCFENKQFRNTNPELYKLVPRTLGKRGVNHVGFKGMTFSDDGERTLINGRYTVWNELFWIEPRLGSRFQVAYHDYIQKHFFGKPKGWPYHPWLFITLEKNRYGMPMTLGAIRQAWKSALCRVGLEKSGLTPHSLRHMYGAYCASVLNLPIELTKTLMHHSSLSSTEVYYHLRAEDVRAAISKAIVKQNLDDELQYLIMPDSPRLNMPSTWNGGFDE